MSRRSSSVELDASALQSNDTLTKNTDTESNGGRSQGDASSTRNSNNTAQSVFEMKAFAAPSAEMHERHVAQRGSKVLDSGKRVEIYVPLIVTDGRLCWQCTVFSKLNLDWVAHEEIKSTTFRPLCHAISQSDKLTPEEKTQTIRLLVGFANHNRLKFNRILTTAGCEPENLDYLPVDQPSSPKHSDI